MANKYITVEIYPGEWAVKDEQLHKKGFSDKLATYCTEENAKLIVSAVNNFNPLVEVLKECEDMLNRNGNYPLLHTDVKELLQSIEKENIL
jgi:hypothetical protein